MNLTEALGMLNPYPLLTQMRKQRPVWHSGTLHGWQVSRYADAKRVLSEYTTFSSILQLLNEDHPWASTMAFLDPPRQYQLRRLVAQAFTPRRIAQLAPEISNVVHDLLNQVIFHGRMDVIADLAAPLPVIVIAQLIGVPSEDWGKLRVWADEQAQVNSMREIHIVEEMHSYFLWIIEQRRANPQNDLISALIAAEVDGQHLTETELLGFCTILFVAGSETTTNLIGNAMLCFDPEPGHAPLMDHLRSNPDLLPLALEEVLRFLPPFPCTRRVATEDVLLGEQEIAAGDLITVRIDAANRDERQFPHPDECNITRFADGQVVNHLSLGHGVHFCIGAPLARLEASIALRTMFERLPTMRRDHTTRLLRSDSLLIYGVQQLPIIF